MESVKEELRELRKWWFDNNKLWFNSNKTDDEEITRKFSVLFYSNIHVDSLNDVSSKIGYIILKDQICRHIVRANNLNLNTIDIHLNKVIEFARGFYESNKNDINCHDFCFTLLPLRHGGIFFDQEYVINETWNKITSLIKDDVDYEKKLSVYKNYLKATYERINDKNIGKVNLLKIDYFNIYEKIQMFVERFKDILDPETFNYKNDNALFNFDANSIVNSCKKINKTENIILSISGGADSMILSLILHKLGYNFVMVHINYSNREECEKEKYLLSLWAKFIGKELFIRDIYEINRSKCMTYDMRKIYEQYTRDARYGAYIQTQKIKDWDNCFVMLGHNYDDCFENIMTNITNKQNYQNLNGMEYLSRTIFKENTINFCRPMISITKSQIYDFAHSNLIPYLYDSTPKWSQRGKIRDIVKPALIEWTSNSIEAMHELKDILSDSMECVDLLVDNWICKIIDKLELSVDGNKVIIETFDKNYKFLKLELTEIVGNKIFWNRFLLKLEIKISAKSLNNLMLKISDIKNNFDKIEINSINVVILHKDNKLYYWKNIEDKIIFSFHN